MTADSRIYLDNAATSWPKPTDVYDAVDDYQRRLGAPAGRGAYGTGVEVQRLVADCRKTIAKLINAREPSRVIFGFNGTDVLNIALHGILREGDHVVTTVVEHNSVLRPLKWLEQHRNISVTRVDCDTTGVIDAQNIADAIKPETKLVVLTHASNVTGAIQPIEEAARIAHQHEALLLLDAAQSLGHLPIDVRAQGIDLLAASGHKGLLGSLGTGVLYVADGLETQLESLRQGGTGTKSEEDTQPRELPHMLEAGNLNVPGIVGLGAGAAYVKRRTVADLLKHERELTERLLKGLSEIASVTIYGPTDSQQRVGVVSCNVEGFEPQELASLLDTAFGIQVRAGLHCAPLVHHAIDSHEHGGTVRFSIGPFNTEDHIDAAIEAIRQIALSTQ